MMVCFCLKIVCIIVLGIGMKVWWFRVVFKVWVNLVLVVEDGVILFRILCMWFVLRVWVRIFVRFLMCI